MSRVGGGNDMDSLPPDLLDFIVCLNDQKVDFVLVGGYALGVHGVIRATGDIDFVYRLTNKNVGRLCVAMVEFGAPENVIDEAALLTRDTVTQFGQSPYRIDLLSSIDGVSFSEVWKGADRREIEGHPVRVIGVRELRKNKAATGRKRDEEDIRRLDARRKRSKK